MYRLQEKAEYPSGICFIIREFPINCTYGPEMNCSLCELEYSTLFKDKKSAAAFKKKYDKKNEWKIVEI